MAFSRCSCCLLTKYSQKIRTCMTSKHNDSFIGVISKGFEEGPGAICKITAEMDACMTAKEQNKINWRMNR